MIDHFIISSLLSLLVARLSTETSTRALQTLWMLQASLLPLQLPAGPELNFWFMGFHHFSETADSAEEWLHIQKDVHTLQTWAFWVDQLEQKSWIFSLLYYCLYLMSFACQSENELELIPTVVSEYIPADFSGYWRVVLNPTAPLGTDLHQLCTSCYPTGFRQGFKSFPESVSASQRPRFKACVATERWQP